MSKLNFFLAPLLLACCLEQTLQVSAATIPGVPPPANRGEDSGAKVQRSPQRRPQIIISTSSRDAAETSAWKNLAQEEAVFFFYPIFSFFDINSTKGKGWIESLKLHPSEGSPLWILMDSNGRVCGSGRSVPTANFLGQLLEQVGEKNPVKALEAFLEQHPGHVEARLELLRAHFHRVQVIMGEVALKGAPVLSASEDTRIWGPVLQHARLLLASNPHPSQICRLYWWLPKEDLERTSPSMKGLYRHIQPILADFSRKIYTFPDAIYFLMRIDRVLDTTSALNTLQGVTFLRTPLHSLFFPPSLSNHLVNAAQKNQAYEQALPLLRQLWEHGKVDLARRTPKVEVSHDEREAHTKKGASKQRALQVHTEAWNQYLKPLLEALILNGQGEAEALSLLSGLGESWRSVPLAMWVGKLATDLGRKDLAGSWQLATSNHSPAPIGRVYLSRGYQFAFSRPPTEEAKKTCQFLLMKGYKIELLTDLDISQREALGWVEPAEKWALIGPDGDLLAKGGRFPDIDRALTLIKEMDIKTPVEMLTDFLRRHPDHVVAKAEKLAELYRYYSQTRDGYVGLRQAGNELIQEEAQRIQMDYLLLLESLLSDADGYTLVVNGLPMFPIQEGDDSLMARGLRDIAHKHLPSIESQIANDPGNLTLWLIWCGLGHVIGRPLQPVRGTLTFSPAQSGEEAMNVAFVLDRYMGLLYRDHRWSQIVSELEPVWSGSIEAALLQGRSGTSSGSLGKQRAWILHTMAVAYLHTGNPTRVDELLNRWAEILPDKGQGIIQAAKTLGYIAEAEKWSKWLRGN